VIRKARETTPVLADPPAVATIYFGDRPYDRLITVRNTAARSDLALPLSDPHAVLGLQAFSAPAVSEATRGTVANDELLVYSWPQIRSAPHLPADE
jgi:hypothetical protein